MIEQKHDASTGVSKGKDESMQGEQINSLRTCVGCRQKDSPQALERFIFVEGAGVIFDLRQKAPGRGAYVHPRASCLDSAIVRGGFARGFKTKVTAVAVDELIEQVKKGVMVRLQESIRVAFAARQALVGETRVKEAMKNDSIAYLFVASDAGHSTQQKYSRNAERKDIAVNQHLTGQLLGQFAGKDFVAVLGLTTEKLARRIDQDMEKLRVLDVF